MNKFKEIIEILSKISTIGIFILAIFGYFYTVKPKFLLDNMNLEMLNIEKNVNTLKNEKINLDNKIQELENEKINLSKGFEEVKNKKDLEIKELQDSFNLQKNDYEKQILSFDDEINNQKKILDDIIREKDFLREKMNEARWSLFLNYLSNLELKKPYNINENNKFFSNGKFYHDNAIITLDKYKFLLNENAPYEILKDSFLSINYSKEMTFTESEFYIYKNRILKLLEENKKYFSYSGTILLTESNNYNEIIKEKLEKIKSLNEENDKFELESLEKDIYNLHDKFEDLRVKKINQLNKEINKVFKKITNLDLEDSKYQISRF